MNKERIKNLLLVFLIAMNFILGSRILIEKKLWPSGYNFFSNTGNWEITKIYRGIKNLFGSEAIYKSRLLSPERLIINTGDQTTRLSLNAGNAEFDGILEEAYAVLQKAFSDGTQTPSVISREEFYSSLAASSVYLEYPAAYSPTLFARLIGAEANVELDIPDGFSQLVISYSPKTSVFITNSKNNEFYRINVDKSCEELVFRLGECLENNQAERPVINYSFDLKFDRPFGEQKTTISPLVQIYSTPGEYPVVTAKNPLFDGESVSEDILNKILNVFSINPNTMRRYTEAGGTYVFVENNATLKIDKSGYLEYEKNTQTADLGDDYSFIAAVSMLADGVNKAVGNDYAMCISDAANGVKLDYVAGGMRVYINSDRMSNGVEATGENGQLKTYRQLLRSYEANDEASSPSEFMTALDDAISEYSKSMNEININKMSIGYNDSILNGELNAEWIVDVDNVIVG